VVPTNVLLQAQVDLLGADPATLAPAALANHLHLAMSPFTPSPNLDVSGVVEATFNTYTALDIGVGTQQIFIDPVTGLRVIQLLEPAGGLHWQTGTNANLPQTIYGYYLTDNADLVMLGSDLLDQPVLLTDAGQGVDIGNVKLRFLTTSPF